MTAKTIPQHVLDRMEDEWRRIRPSNTNDAPQPAAQPAQKAS